MVGSFGMTKKKQLVLYLEKVKLYFKIIRPIVSIIHKIQTQKTFILFYMDPYLRDGK